MRFILWRYNVGKFTFNAIFVFKLQGYNSANHDMLFCKCDVANHV